MRTASSALNTHLGQSATTLAFCWKVKRTDGVILGFTEHDQDLEIDVGDGDGTVVYKAATGYRRSELKASIDFQVDGMDVAGVLDSDAITAADIRAGRYDFAEVKPFLVNWADTSQGILKFPRGWLGEISMTEIGFKAELMSMMDRFNTQEIVEVNLPTCRADVFDSRCGVQKAAAWQPLTAYSAINARDAAVGSYVKPTSYNDRWFQCTTAGTSASGEPAWDTTIGNTTGDGSVVWTAIQARIVEATVASVIDRSTFTISYSGDAPDAFLTEGLLVVQDSISPSPANANIKREIKTWTLSTKTVVLKLPLPFDLEVGDPVNLQVGCDKIHDSDCQGTFGNIRNFRGEPHVPGNDLLFRTPDAH